MPQEPPSVLPCVLGLEDVAAVLKLRTTSAARRAVLSGRCGRYFRDGRRILVRREQLLAAIEAREVEAPRKRGRS